MRRASIVLATVVLAGCGGSEQQPAAPPPVTTAARQAPEISGRTLDGERVSLSDFRGKPVLVNVWSSW